MRVVAPDGFAVSRTQPPGVTESGREGGGEITGGWQRGGTACGPARPARGRDAARAANVFFMPLTLSMALIPTGRVVTRRVNVAARQLPPRKHKL